MSDKLKHWGMFGVGLGCLALSVFLPVTAPVLGPLGTKLLGAGAGGALMLLTDLAKMKQAKPPQA